MLVPLFQLVHLHDELDTILKEEITKIICDSQDLDKEVDNTKPKVSLDLSPIISPC